jgi:RNA polymerase sigma-70 factor, ECF subfamily
MNAPIDWDWDRYRKLLRVLARSLKLDPRLRTRFDESDLVSETLMRAWKALAAQHPDTPEGRKAADKVPEAQRIAWLQKILANAFIDMYRQAHGRGCNVDLERSLEQSSLRLDAILPVKQPSPSEQAERKEMRLKLAEAIERLPDDQRDVFIQRDLLDLKVGEIAKELGKTEKAVAGLLRRARQELREYLQDFQ